MVALWGLLTGYSMLLEPCCPKEFSPHCFAERTKYLGIQLDQHLVWNDHTRLLRAKVSRAIGFLKYAKTILPQETLSQIYRGIVEPHFRYCCSVWGICGESRRLTLQKLQNRAARIAVAMMHLLMPLCNS